MDFVLAQKEGMKNTNNNFWAMKMFVGSDFAILRQQFSSEQYNGEIRGLMGNLRRWSFGFWGKIEGNFVKLSCEGTNF